MAKTNNPRAYDQDRGTYAVDIEGNAFKNVTASKTMYISTSAGVLHAVVLNTNGGTVDIYDNRAATGTKVGQIASDAPEGQFVYDVAYSNGLTVVTGATVDCTVVYRPGSSTINSPSVSPSISPSVSPSISPSASPSLSPSSSVSPSPSPSTSPSNSPSASPSVSPSNSPSTSPSTGG